MKKRILAFIAAGIICASTLQTQSLTPSTFSWPAFTKHIAYHLRAGLLTLGIGALLIKLAKHTTDKPRTLEYYANQYRLDYTYENWNDFIQQGFGKTKCTINFKKLNGKTQNMSNDELKDLCNRAAINAGASNRARIKEKDFKKALRSIKRVRFAE
jgi:hypothetical protein